MGNDQVKDIFDKVPLLKFSIDTAWQVQALENKANDLKKISDRWTDGIVHEFTLYHENFWFWILGAYEVVRTISQHQNCFCHPIRIEAQEIKRHLAELRMPFAKQELRGNQHPLRNENSVSSVDGGLVFSIKGQQYNSTETLDLVMNFLKSISKCEILSGIPKHSAKYTPL